jgi:hypothetical protein
MTEILANEYVIDLTTIGHGAAVELFDAELKKVLDNIADFNTDPETVREITLKVTFEPTEDRRAAAVSVQVKSKLAGHRGTVGAVFFGMVDGQRAAVESNPRQGKLFDNTEGRVVMLKKEKEEK